MSNETKIYVFGFTSDGYTYPYPGIIWSFNVSANGGLGAWSEEPETEPFPNVPIRSHDSYDWRGNFMVRYNNGDFGVIYKEEIAGGNATGRLFFRLWDGVWEDVIEIIPSLAFPTVGTIIYDPNTELIYLFYHPYWPNENDLRLRTISHDGTISNELFAFPTATDASTAYTGKIHDGIMMIGWTDATYDITNPIWEWNMSESVNFTKKYLPLYPGEINAPRAAAIFYGANELPVAIHTHGQDRVYLSERSNDGIWGDPTILFDDTPDLYPYVFGAGSRYKSQGSVLGLLLRKKAGPADADNELWYLHNGLPFTPVNISLQVPYSITGAPLPGENDHAAAGAQYINNSYWFLGCGPADGSSRNIAAIRSGGLGGIWTLQDSSNAPSLGQWGWIFDTYYAESSINPNVADSFSLSDSIQIRLDSSSIPNFLVLDKCPTIVLASQYCTGFKNGQMGDEDPLACDARFYEISTEQCP